MFLPTIFWCLFLTTHGALVERATCGTDNCGRAVVGTKDGAAQVSRAMTDCSSFMRSVVYQTVVPTPATATLTAYVSPVKTNLVTLSVVSTIPTTVTLQKTTTVAESSTATIESELDVPTTLVITQTATETDQLTRTILTTTTQFPEPDPVVIGKRATSAPVFPIYASACSSSTARYWSACSCFGVTAFTVTSFITQPQLTISTTTTSTVLQTISVPVTEVFLQTQTASSYVTVSSFTTLIITETSFSTNLIPTTVLVTSLTTTTRLATITNIDIMGYPTPPACTAGSALLTGPTYQFNIGRDNDYRYYGLGKVPDLITCCAIAYGLPDTLIWLFGSNFGCLLYYSTSVVDDGGPSQPHYCPNGVSATEELYDGAFGSYFSGPCDLAGQQYL